ncbi:MAG: ferredoxin--NADP(+) reductase [Gammaproteobacteria bacterium]|nr:ferredoxin--NADP(+) reductase [Gammaproteobacteria bacterium]
MKTDILVIGAGPVGLFTVFEAGILGLKCTLIDNLDKPGGQCAELYPDKPIFDIPGVPYQTAQEHVDALLKQIEPFEYDLMLNERVDSMIKKGDRWEVTTNKGSTIETPNIFIAAGAGSFEPIKPNLESDFSSLEGKKIFYSIKDKTIFKDKNVVIFGGGDSALDWTVELQKVGAEVTLIHRRDAFRGAPDTEMNVRKLSDEQKIKLLTPFIIKDISGNENIDSIKLLNTDSKDEIDIKADYILFFYGLNKKLGPIIDWNLELSGKKIQVNTESFKTDKEGIFAVGDINTYPGKLNLILSGFHETTLAVQKAFSRVHPGERIPFGYTTSSKQIHKKLGYSEKQ